MYSGLCGTKLVAGSVLAPVQIPESGGAEGAGGGSDRAACRH